MIGLVTSELIQRVRIESIHLTNFKGVSDGVIEFNCAKNPFEKDIQSDILGIYGQNGSGKTTALEAIQLARTLMMGHKLRPEKHASLIAQGSDSARMEITFQFINSDESVFHAEYAFSIAYKDIPNPEAFLHRSDSLVVPKNSTVYNPSVAAPAAIIAGSALIAGFVLAGTAASALAKKKNENIPDTVRQLVVYDEVISLSGRFYGVDYRFAPVFDTRSEDVAFLPKAKHSEFFPINTSSVLKDLERIKNRSRASSRSFIFSDDVKQLISEQLSNPEGLKPFNIFLYLFGFHAVNNMRILDSIIVGASRDQVVPIYTSNSHVDIRLSDSTAKVNDQEFDTLRRGITGLNIILEQLIPGLSLEAVEQVDKDIDNSSVKQTANYKKVTVYSVRENTRIALSQESTGILHLISSLGLISYAFSNPCVTVAIDEIDAGIYEYLLGELLLIFEEYGRGQLIFTCHNLRPMEVLNKKFVCFTTTNPNNRYLKLKNVRKEKNLRDAYLKEIIDCGQDEVLYSSAKHGKIASALQKAGEIIGQKT